jgi:hypothetical protein
VGMYHKTKGLKSVLNNLDKDSLQSLLDGSVSIRDFFRKINVRDIGNNRNRFGWVKKLSTKWKISHTQVKKWILRNIPEIQFYQRKVKRI